jgi:hypothetical protein
MTEQRPSAAAALYPNLPHDDGREADWTTRRRERSESVASAMYPRPKPLPKNPYLEPMTEQAWREELWALAGLRRKR